MPTKDNIGRLLHPAFELVEFLLNDGAADPDVMSIFGLCRELDELRRKPRKTSTRKASALWELNNTLARFQFTPLMTMADSYQVFWKAAHETGVEPSAISAANLVKLILSMTETGDIALVRRCICGKWFYAQTSKKTVCSDGCRFQKFKANAGMAFNSARAQYMRDYRNNPIVKANARRQRGKAKAR